MSLRFMGLAQLALGDDGVSLMLGSGGGSLALVSPSLLSCPPSTISSRKGFVVSYLRNSGGFPYLCRYIKKKKKKKNMERKERKREGWSEEGR